MNFDDIAKYAYEVGQLKRVKRSGWWTAGISDPESVAEHSFRTAVLADILASLEGADPQQAAVICLFHDIGESRIGDFHHVAKRYISAKEGEERAFEEQVSRLPQEVANDLLHFMHDYQERSTLEAKVAHDADLLECIVQAREYQVQGYGEVQDWISNSYTHLQTASAKRLADACIQMEPSAWWQGLKVKK